MDDTKESLIGKSHMPLTPHPKTHTQIKIKLIKDYIRRNPNISLCELYSKLRTEKGHSRHTTSLFRVITKMDIYINKETKSKYTPKNIGIKWQIDVKYVPKLCYSGIDRESFYQYTIIDEASRERFIYSYKEQSSFSTVDFF